MKIVVLGAAGRMGQMHARHLIEMGHTVYGVDHPRQPQIAGHRHVIWTSMNHIPADVEAVVIASPADCHAEQFAAAIGAGRHVFIEKPICIIEHLDETRKAVELARERRLIVAVGYNLRFHPAVMSVYDEIATGMLKPMWGSFVLRQKPPRPVAYFLEEWASHDVDLALHLMGGEHLDAASLLRGKDEIKIVIQHGPQNASFIHADAYTEPFRRAFTIVDQEGCARTWDIERNHVKPDDYKAELMAWVDAVWATQSSIDPPLSPLATGEDGLAVIELLARVMR